MFVIGLGEGEQTRVHPQVQRGATGSEPILRVSLKAEACESLCERKLACATAGVVHLQRHFRRRGGDSAAQYGLVAKARLSTTTSYLRSLHRRRRESHAKFFSEATLTSKLSGNRTRVKPVYDFQLSHRFQTH